MEKHTEIEVKLVSMAVTQFKFSVISTAAKVAKEVRILCDLLGITHGQLTQFKICDTYYDDQNRTLATQGCSIRHRIGVSKNPEVTFKKPKGFRPIAALERDEVTFECTNDEFQQIVSDSFCTRLAEAFNGNWCQNATCGRLGKSLTVHNRRTQFPIKTNVGEYEFW